MSFLNILLLWIIVLKDSVAVETVPAAPTPACDECAEDVHFPVMKFQIDVFQPAVPTYDSVLRTYVTSMPPQRLRRAKPFDSKAAVVVP